MSIFNSIAIKKRNFLQEISKKKPSENWQCTTDQKWLKYQYKAQLQAVHAGVLFPKKYQSLTLKSVCPNILHLIIHLYLAIHFL